MGWTLYTLRGPFEWIGQGTIHLLSRQLTLQNNPIINCLNATIIPQAKIKDIFNNDCTFLCILINAVQHQKIEWAHERTLVQLINIIRHVSNSTIPTQTALPSRHTSWFKHLAKLSLPQFTNLLFWPLNTHHYLAISTNMAGVSIHLTP